MIEHEMEIEELFDLLGHLGELIGEEDDDLVEAALLDLAADLRDPIVISPIVCPRKLV